MKIMIERECNCIIKLNYKFKSFYANEEELEKESILFLSKLNKSCCKTHTFKLDKIDNNFHLCSSLNTNNMF